MERVIVLLLVGTMFCLTVEAAYVEQLNFCPSFTFDSCDSANCTCASDNNLPYDGTNYNCSSVCETYVTYRVEFIPQNSSCYDYFSGDNLGLWSFRGFSHQPSCHFNSNESCCTNETTQDYFNTTGLDAYATLNVTRDYPYVSLAADLEAVTVINSTTNETTTTFLSLGVDRLRLCNGYNWLDSVQTCGVYRYPNQTDLSATCVGECADTVVAPGCFNLTRVSDVPNECTTDSPTTPVTSPTTAAEGGAATTETSAGSAATHSLGLTVFLFVLLQFVRAVIN